MPPRPDYRRSRHAFAGTVGAAGDLALTVYGQAMTPERSDQLAVAIESERYLLPWQGDSRWKLDIHDARHSLSAPSMLRDTSEDDVSDGDEDVEESVEIRVDDDGRWRVYDALRADWDVVGPDDLDDLWFERYQDLLRDGRGRDEAGPTQMEGDASPTLAAAPTEFPPPPMLQPGTVPPWLAMGPDAENAPVVAGPRYIPPFDVPAELDAHLPPNARVDRVVTQTAAYVRAGGIQAELTLRVRQTGNPLFNFLDEAHPVHAYYRWVLAHDPQPTRSTERGQGESEREADGALRELASYDSDEETTAAPMDGGAAEGGAGVREMPSAVQAIVDKMSRYVQTAGPGFVAAMARKAGRAALEGRFSFLDPCHALHGAFLRSMEKAAGAAAVTRISADLRALFGESEEQDGGANGAMAGAPSSPTPAAQGAGLGGSAAAAAGDGGPETSRRIKQEERDAGASRGEADTGGVGRKGSTPVGREAGGDEGEGSSEESHERVGAGVQAGPREGVGEDDSGEGTLLSHGSSVAEGPALGPLWRKRRRREVENGVQQAVATAREVARGAKTGMSAVGEGGDLEGDAKRRAIEAIERKLAEEREQREREEREEAERREREEEERCKTLEARRQKARALVRAHQVQQAARARDQVAQVVKGLRAALMHSDSEDEEDGGGGGTARLRDPGLGVSAPLPAMRAGGPGEAATGPQARQREGDAGADAIDDLSEADADLGLGMSDGE